jgi:hypothetical protein
MIGHIRKNGLVACDPKTNGRPRVNNIVGFNLEMVYLKFGVSYFVETEIAGKIPKQNRK